MGQILYFFMTSVVFRVIVSDIYLLATLKRDTDKSKSAVFRRLIIYLSR